MWWRGRARWLVLWSLWAARVLRQPGPPRSLQSGLLQGSIAPDGSHQYYYGIPYATISPEHKFKAPGPAPVWEGTFHAIHDNVRCQQSLGDKIMIGVRDCLMLNIYTPLDANPGDKYPVMVFIHGGGFFSGSGSSLIYGPNYLVSKGVILVTFNYRLNIQGFACLGIKEAPGNAGMKDQVAALKWVQRNIKAFGGDPDNVTIFGESAGAASVSYHLISPMSRGLFHKAITQSGSSLAPWAFQYNPIYLASLLAKTMGYVTRDPKKLYDYFMSKTDDELILTRVPRAEGNIIISEILYTPCAEPVIEGEEAFLTETPSSLLSKGNFHKVPLMIGFTSEEGLLFAALENATTIPLIRFEKSLPKNLAIPDENERHNIGARLKKYYMGDDEVTMDTSIKLSQFHGEPNLVYPSLEETELVLKSSDEPVYNYMLNYSSWRNLPKMILGNPYRSAPGATHADDLFYIFSQAIVPSFLEYNMIARISTMWTNFAKFGNPTPESSSLLPVKWLPTNSTLPTSLVIDEVFSTKPLWYTDSLKYLRHLYSKYKRRR